MTEPGSQTYPLITIGVPVFNEAAHLAPALSSLRAQDYPNLEIVISDNGSTDQTEEICLQHAKSDDRIKYHRLSTNHGPAYNSNRIIDLASGEFFVHASGHDRWTPDYISACFAELARRPDAVIAFGSTEWIDETDAPYPKDTGWSDTRGMSALERFFTQLWGNMHPLMGVARVDAVRRALPFADMASADLAFLLEMSLMGDFIHVPDVTWYRRETRGPQSYRQRMRRYRSKAFGLIRSPLGAVFPYGRLLVRVPRIVLRSSVSPLEKVILLALLFPTTVGRYAAARRRHGTGYERERAARR